MSKVDEYRAVAQQAIDGYDQATALAQPYVSELVALNNADPCVVGFEQRIEEVATKENALDDALKNLQPNVKFQEANRISSTLTSEERSRFISDIRDKLINSAKQFSLTLSPTKTVSLDAIRAKFKACPALKDPANPKSDTTTDTKTDPAVAESSTDKKEPNDTPTSTKDDNVTDKKAASETANAAKVGVGSTPQEKTVGGAPTVAGVAGGSGTNNTSTNVPQSDSVNLEKAGKRQWNPLSKFSSYTYRITLYLMLPEAYEEFKDSGRKSIPTTGTYIVAQSAGVNNESSKRLPGVKFDYYIDELKLTNTVAGEGHTGNASYDWSFNIIEPYGFSFPTNLALAFQELKATSTTPNYSDASNSNATNQIYVLGIKFLGYDSSGKIIIKNETPYERYYDIKIIEFKFSLDGRATTYRLKASDVGQSSGMGTEYGTVNNTTKIQGKNVNELLTGPNGLFTIINEREKTLAKTKPETSNSPTIKKVANKYEVKFEGEDAEFMKNSLIIELDKNAATPMSPAKNTTEVNDKTSERVIPDFVNRTVTIAESTPIVQTIETIMSYSTFIKDRLKTSIESKNEPKKGNWETDGKERKIPFKWIRVNSDVTITGYDPITQTFSRTITYIITSYEVPFIENAYVNKRADYYGAFKFYDYWFTGKNSEVIKYEQSINNLYYLSDFIGGSNPNSRAPVAPGQKSGADVSGQKNGTLTPESSVWVSLQDAGSLVKSKISILGDPDFLMQPYSKGSSKFYGSDGYGINPNNGDVFIEIKFNEAVDYDYDAKNKSPFSERKGLMTINPSIVFYDPKITTIPPGFKGLSYKVLKCVSSFSKGSFTQELELALNFFPPVQGSNPATARENTAGNTTGNTSSSPNSQAPTTGMKPDPNNKNPLIVQETRTGVSQPTNASDDAQADVNTRVKAGVSSVVGAIAGREGESLINRARRTIGLPAGGTSPGSPTGTGGG